MVDHERELRQIPPGRAVNDRAAGGRIERRVVAGADECRLWGRRREQRLPVLGDRAPSVGTDLGIGEDALGSPVRAAGRKVDPVRLDPDDHDRGGEHLMVDVLGIRRVEGRGRDVVRAVWPPILVHESPPAVPGRVVEGLGVERGPQRDGRHDERRAQSRPRRPRRALEEALAGHPAAALLNDLDELLLLVAIADLRVLLLELLLDDQPRARDPERRGE